MRWSGRQWWFISGVTALGSGSVGCGDESCVSDADCKGNRVCDAAVGACVDPPGSGGSGGGNGDKQNGELCDGGAECVSGHCPPEDGVCCDAPCTDACVSCSGDKTGAADGTCAAVAVDTDPDGECVDEGAETCGSDGSGCNGDASAPGCNLYAADTECAAANCQNGMAAETSHCDGDGSCVSGETTSCHPYACDASAPGCLSSCSSDIDCASDSWCQNPLCVPKKSNGESCIGGNECVSGSCSDDVCCDQACGGGCDVCSQALGATADGACTIVPFGTAVNPSCSPGAVCDGTSGMCTPTCVSAPAQTIGDQADVIFVIDNSGSMADEMIAIESTINAFAATLANAGVDYRIIMVTDHGADFVEVCVPPPLSSTSNCAGAPGEIATQFYHYDANIQSSNSLCVLLDTLNGGTPDEWNLHPAGWLSLLRPAALKAFIEVSDDWTNCTWNSTAMIDNNQVAAGQQAATAFDQLLLAQSPTQFGTTLNRRYVFYDLIGVAPKIATDYTVPYDPSEAVVTTTCPGGTAPGTGYQWLAKTTGGLRFGLCNANAFGGILNTIAQDIAGKTSNQCALAIPPPPGIQTPDPTTLLVEYFPGVASPSQMFTQVANLASCTAGAFYLENGVIQLCPSACATVLADPGATLEVHYFCI